MIDDEHTYTYPAIFEVALPHTDGTGFGYTEGVFDRMVLPLITKHGATLAWKKYNTSCYEITFQSRDERRQFQIRLELRLKRLYPKAELHFFFRRSKRKGGSSQ